MKSTSIGSSQSSQRESSLMPTLFSDLKNYYLRYKAKKLIEKNQKQLVTTLVGSYSKKLDAIYTEQILTGRNSNGSSMFDWDKKDKEGKENGGSKYIAVTESPLYKKYIYEPEVNLLIESKAMIEQIFLDEQPQRVIDLGGGDGHKTATILKALDPNIVGSCNFTTKDISVHLGHLYKQNIEKEIGKKASFIPESFLEKAELQSNKDKRIFLSLGLGIGNADDQDIVTTLSNMISDVVLGKRSSVLTIGIAPNKNSSSYQDDIHKLLAIYGSPDTNNPYYNQESHRATEDWIMSGIHYHLGDIVTNKIKFDVQYEDQGEQGGRVILGAKVIEPFTYTIGDQVYYKKKGDMIYGIQSRKPSIEHFSSLVKKAGCSLESVKTQDGIGLFHVKTPGINTDSLTISQLQKRKRNTRLFSAGLLLLGGILINKVVTSYNAKTQKENRWEQKVKDEFGNGYGNRGYGLTAKGLDDTRDLIYKNEFKDMYGVANTDELKYDFLSWYIAGVKKGEIRLSNPYSTVPSIERIEAYVAENKLRLEFDKGIVLIPHKELQDKEDILRNTLALTTDSIEEKGLHIPKDDPNKYGYYAQNYSKGDEMNYVLRNGMKVKYIVISIDGKQVILGKQKDDTHGYTTDIGKRIATDYFTPELYEKASAVVESHIKKTTGNDTVTTKREIQDRMLALRIQGYAINYYDIILKEKDEISMQLFVETYMSDIIASKDISGIQYNIRPRIEYLITSIEQFTTQQFSSQERNKIFSRICNYAFKRGDFPLLYSGNGPKEWKEWFTQYAQELLQGINNSFPFKGEFGAGYKEIISSEGSIIDGQIREKGNSSYNVLATDFQGVYITKIGLKFNRGYLESGGRKYLVAHPIEDNNTIQKQYRDTIINKYIEGNKRGRTKEETDIFNQGKTPQNYQQYEIIVSRRKEIEDKCAHIVGGYNTYFGEMIYNDRLDR